MKKFLTDARFHVLAMSMIFVVAGCQAITAPGDDVATGRLGAQGIKYVHDDEHKVGCWFYVSEAGSSISCLPDNQYRP